MRGQKSGNRLTGRIAGRLAGAMGLLLALCLIAGGVLPGYASDPPNIPHYFSGSVSFNGDPVEEGTLVKAFVADVEAAWTIVDDQSRYALGVRGTAGAEVTFEVGCVPANETATWQSGKVQQLNLTIDEPPGPPVPRYALTMAADPVVGGNATDETGGAPYAAGAKVRIKAEPAAGYGFVNWTANTTVTFVNATAAETTFTMPAQAVNVTAHFEVAYNLTMAADPLAGGDAIDVAAEGAYVAGVAVRIKAEPAAGYGFVNWTANTTVTFGNATAEETTFTMPAQAVNVTAHFGVAYNLTMAADPLAGGNATDVAAKGAYAAGVAVRIKAEPAAGYGFVNWTANTTVTFSNATAEETTFTMPAQAVNVTAHFGVAYNLTMVADPVGGGNATDVAAKGAYAAGAAVRIKAEPAAGYGFVNWTANTTVTFGNATTAETTFTMPAQNVTVTAHFEVVSQPQEIPTVTTQPATDISSYSAFLNMSYTVGDFNPVEVRFACKRSTDPAWFYTIWVSRTADGTYTEVLTGLVPETEYVFKAQLKYSGTEIGDVTSRFTTATGASTGISDFLGYFGCFIATAAYGTPTAEQIDVLREFRDVVLLKSTVGSQFVALYYRLSPPIADFIARSDFLRTLVRELLVDPIVWIVEATGDIWRN
jgi:hypothetical protein